MARPRSSATTAPNRGLPRQADIPGIAGEAYRRRAAEAAAGLLAAVGYGSKRGPWLDVGVGVHAGTTYVGNVGADGIMDFTAVGDAVNTASRLQSLAGGGEVILSESVYPHVRATYPDLAVREVTVIGKADPIPVRTLRIGSASE